MENYKDDDKDEVLEEEYDENEEGSDYYDEEYSYLLEDDDEEDSNNSEEDEEEEDSYTENEDNEKSKKGSFLLTLFEWGITIAAALLISFLINKFLIFKVYIPSESMFPTLQVKDQLFVTKMYDPKTIQRGDILVFYSQEYGDLLIKRVIGLPGDDIIIKASGEVLINGEVLEEAYVKEKDQMAVFDLEFSVPEGEYFFLGDNRANSLDSRYWKDPYISFEDIRGEARVLVYPFRRMRIVT